MEIDPKLLQILLENDKTHRQMIQEANSLLASYKELVTFQREQIQYLLTNQAISENTLTQERIDERLSNSESQSDPPSLFDDDEIEFDPIFFQNEVEAILDGSNERGIEGTPPEYTGEALLPDTDGTYTRE